MGAATLDTAFFAAWIEEITRSVGAEKDRLTRLDAAIGDADHGTNLDRGFTAIAQALADKEPDTPGALLTLVGSTLIRKVGGASGPLYGTAFREAGKALADVSEVSAAELVGALEAALAGVQKLGSAAEGDKTMVDALAPAVRALAQAVQEGKDPREAAEAAASAALAGAEATVPMQARKGRASYLGPRSVGHEDPGAASTALILTALRTVAAPRSAGGSPPAGPTDLPDGRRRPHLAQRPAGRRGRGPGRADRRCGRPGGRGRGTEDGRLGTSPDLVAAAVEKVDQGDGVVLIPDLGSSVLTARLAEGPGVVIADVPFVEGAIAAVVTAGAGASLEAVLAAAEESRTFRKL